MDSTFFRIAEVDIVIRTWISARTQTGSGIGRERKPRRRRVRFLPWERGRWAETLEGRALLTATQFAVSFGGTVVQASAEAVANDAAGNTYVTGSFTGTVNFGGVSLTSAGATDVYVAKLDIRGQVVWARRMGSSASGLTDGDYGRGIAVDGSGNVYVSGFFTGTGDFGGTTLNSAGGRDAFVVKFNSVGSVAWAKDLGGNGDDLGQALTLDNAGNIYTIGSFSGTANFTSTPLTSAGGTDIYVIKQDVTGAVVGAVNLGGAGDDAGFGIVYDASSNSLITTGTFSNSVTFGTTTLTSAGDTDIFVAKLSTSLTPTWAVGFGGAGHDSGVSVAVDASGGVYATGDYVGSATFGGTTVNGSGPDDAFVARVSSAGAFQWVRTYSGSGADSGWGVVVDPSGNAWATGIYQNTVAFGSTNLTSNGDYDVYLTELDSNGNTLYAQSFGSSTSDIAFAMTIGGPNHNLTISGVVGGQMNIGNFGVSGAYGAYVVQVSTTPKTTPSQPGYDFNGVGYSQLAVFRPSNAFWYAENRSGSVQLKNPNNPTGAFGGIGLYDIPVVGDFDGVGHAELGVFRPSTAQWFVVDPMNPSATPHQIKNPANASGAFGATNLYDIPVPGDYDGVGHTELAIFRPSTAEWFVVDPLNPSSTPHQIKNPANASGAFGAINLFDLPVPGDYDGVGHTELAIYRPLTAQWFVVDPLNPSSTPHQIRNPISPDGGFGLANSNDIPVPGDYLGLGYIQPAIYRPSTAEWFVLGPNGGIRMNAFGAVSPGDIPVQSPAGALARLGRIRGASLHSASATQNHPGASASFVVAAGTTSTAAAPAVAAPSPGTTSSANPTTVVSLNTRDTVSTRIAPTVTTATPFTRRSLIMG